MNRIGKIKIDWALMTVLGVVALVVLAGLFAEKKTVNKQTASTKVTTRGANALELFVTNVNPVIARQFHLDNVSGVLVNDAPRGTVRRLAGLRKGDVILEYNNVSVHSPQHLRQLMAQNHPGDTVAFMISRDGKVLVIPVKIPQSAGVLELYNPTFLDIAVVVLILIVTFTLLFFDVVNRTVCVVLGAVLMMISGSLLGFYSQTKAFDAILMSPILIFVGISIFSILLEKFEFFDYVAKTMILKTKGDIVKVAFVLCLLTYVFSLVVNNLTAILVMIPITLSLCRGLKMNPVPVVIAEIIASNVGGASTMIGDFPNMIISSSTGLNFIEYLIFMTPICFVLLLSLFWYMRRFAFVQRKKIKTSLIAEKAFLKKIQNEVNTMEINWGSIKRVLWIFGAVIVGFIVLPVFRIKAATIALAGGFTLLAIEKEHAREVLKKISFTDVIFFIALFIIVGGALHSGLLEMTANAISYLSMGSKFFYLVILMCFVAFVTAFLNAGPSTVFFIPVVMHAPFAAYSDIIWWALSLGVLAGSSATITGATAGIVTQTILEEQHISDLGADENVRLTFRNYSKHGIPVALMFLVISSIYIGFLCCVMQ